MPQVPAAKTAMHVGQSHLENTLQTDLKAITQNCVTITPVSDEINELQHDWTKQWGTIDEADLQEKETTLVQARVAET